MNCCRSVRDGNSGRRWTCVVVVASMLACAGSAAAAAEANPDVKDAPRDAGQVTRLGEIIIDGKADSLKVIQQAIIETETRFNLRYNELNKDDRYDIVCRSDKPMGSHVPLRTCEAKIVDEQTEDESNEFFTNLSTGAPTSIISPDALRRQANLEVNRRALALARSDPELLRYALERVRLQRLYKEAGRKKVKGWWRSLTGRSEQQQK